MMRYGLSGTWRSFTTAGGGPAGDAWRRAPPPQPASAMTMPLSTTTRAGAATCLGYLPLSETASSDGAPRASQSPNAAASFARPCGQALLVRPLLDPVRIGVGGDRPLEQVALHRQADRVRRRVALAAPPPPLRRVERGEQLGAHDRRARVHASTSTVLHHLHNLHQPRIGGCSTMRPSSGYPGLSGRW